MKTLLILFLATLAVQANPDLFRESFADPATRPAAIATLTPGTRDHFFYTALDHQLSDRAKEYADIVADWKAAAERQKSPVSSDGLKTLEARRVLKDYDRDPKAALTEMRREMDLDFDDTRPDSAAEEKALTTSLDAKLITADAFRKQAAIEKPRTPYDLYSQEVLYAELDGLEKFTEDQVRWFIRSFKLTQHPKYVALLVKGTTLKNPIAAEDMKLDPLSLAQMDELRKAVPAMHSSSVFNAAYLTKLKPTKPKDLERDPKAHAAARAEFAQGAHPPPPPAAAGKAGQLPAR
jgi:hypothetical protein